MSRISSWSAVAWSLAMAVFAPHPGSAATNISSQTSATTPRFGKPSRAFTNITATYYWKFQLCFCWRWAYSFFGHYSG